jgi:predicted HicB family RNase H-like nuclease
MSTLARVPNKPKTPQTPFRIPAELKEAAVEKAQAEGRTLTDVVLTALRQYIRTDPKEK